MKISDHSDHFQVDPQVAISLYHFFSDRIFPAEHISSGLINDQSSAVIQISLAWISGEFFGKIPAGQ